MTRKVKPEEKPTCTPLVEKIECKCSTCFHFDGYEQCQFPLPEWLVNMFLKYTIVRPYEGGSCMCWKEKNNG